jgi:hypothetical protein
MNITPLEHDGGTNAMDTLVREALTLDRLTESKLAREEAFRKLVADGLEDTEAVRLACSIMFNKGASWAMGVMDEEIAKLKGKP